MQAEILTTGDEIRTGALIDSNAAFIAQELINLGIDVNRHTSVGDELHQLVTVLDEISQRAEVAVVTGGLGPTSDDLTAAAAAQCAGVPLLPDERVLAHIEGFFKRMGRPMAPSNRKQAMLPKGSTCLDNPVGTAPGFMMTISRCRFFFLPGVPKELKRMFTQQVQPRLTAANPLGRRIVVKTLSTFGLPESAVNDRLIEFKGRFPSLKLGFRAMFPLIQVKLYTGGDCSGRGPDSTHAAIRWLHDRLGVYLISEDGHPLERMVGDLLVRQDATLALAESCTGGLIAHQITSVAGSSDYFTFGAVAYANEAKIKVLGVSPQTIEVCGAVSEETVAEMAQGARQRGEATYGLATSGIAGPGGATSGKPVGTVCIGLAGPNRLDTQQLQYAYGKRGLNKTIFAAAALDMLRRRLLHQSSRE
jgi:nicotinamide-nucleotide amidase